MSSENTGHLTREMFDELCQHGVNTERVQATERTNIINIINNNCTLEEWCKIAVNIKSLPTPDMTEHYTLEQWIQFAVNAKSEPLFKSG